MSENKPRYLLENGELYLIPPDTVIVQVDEVTIDDNSLMVAHVPPKGAIGGISRENCKIKGYKRSKDIKNEH